MSLIESKGFKVVLIDKKTLERLTSLEFEGAGEVLEKHILVLWGSKSIIIFLGDMNNKFTTALRHGHCKYGNEGDLAFDGFAGQIINVLSSDHEIAFLISITVVDLTNLSGNKELFTQF